MGRRGMTDSSEPNVCAGYLRQPHPALTTLEFQYPDGHKTGLCRVCATRWLLSDEEFPPEEIRTTPKSEDKTPPLTTSESVT